MTSWKQRRNFVLFVLAGTIANGMAHPAIEAWKAQGLGATVSLFGLSPLALLIGATALAQMATAPLPRHGMSAAWLAMGALLVPSSLVAWAVLLGFSLLLAAGLTREWRGGPLLAAGLAAGMAWQILAARLLGPWLELPDAIAVQHTLALFTSEVVRDGNLVSKGSHEIVVLAGCTTLQTLPLVCLAAAAATVMRAPNEDWRSTAWCLCSVALGFTLLNHARLLLLGWSGPFYNAVHGPLGQNLFDALTILMAMAAPMPRRAALSTP